MQAIKTVGLTKFYGSARGIIDVDLTVEEGDLFGFIGPNGAGKSTAVRTLLGLLSPTRGEALIFGKDCQKQKSEILRDVGYLPSEVNFYHGMRVSEMLRLCAGLRGLDCRESAAKLCERLLLDPTRRIDELSLGNRKKLGIVCALQHAPRLCILDEPTSGLDPLMQREFYSILQEHNQKGMTVFLSSHILSEVGRYCKHAAVIRDGRILVSDSVERLAHTGIKRVSLRVGRELPMLEGMRDLTSEGETHRFLYEGAPERLLRLLADLSPEDVSITDPDLDEIFMHYYEKEEA